MPELYRGRNIWAWASDENRLLAAGEFLHLNPDFKAVNDKFPQDERLAIASHFLRLGYWMKREHDGVTRYASLILPDFRIPCA